MCSTTSRGHYFGVLQTKNFWKGPTSSFHVDFISGYLLAAPLRAAARKCVALSAPVQARLFRFHENKAFSASHNPKLPPRLYFSLFARNNSEIWRP